MPCVRCFLRGFADELVKLGKEFAPGIPSKEVSHELPELEEPTTWEFGVHDHDATKRGRHFDLRLGDPETGRAHSWATMPELPGPGEKTWAIQQPTHTVGYMNFKGTIPEGYGAGKVKIHARDKVEVTNARPGHISFNRYTGRGPEEYTLHRVHGRNWLLMNRTPSRTSFPDIPTDKPDYKAVKPEEAPYADPNMLLSAKIDDAHTIFAFPKPGEQVRAFSFREGKRAQGGIIEHTHKVPGLRGVRTPKGMGDTIVRGGLFALNPETKQATPSKLIGGMLNSMVWKSREAQKQHGDLIPVLYDVVKFRGKDMIKAPYGKKLEVLEQIQQALPKAFVLPPMARTEAEKRKLMADIRAGKLPETKEGGVFQHMLEYQPPVKAKYSDEFDVYLRGFYAGEGKYKGRGVGGFEFSHTPDGPAVGRVASGLSDAQRIDMHKNPEKYLGVVAKVTAQEKFPSGALRGPVFDSWHLDKSDQHQLDEIIH